MDIVDVVSNIVFGQNAFKVEAPLKKDVNERTFALENKSTESSLKINDLTIKEQSNSKELVTITLNLFKKKLK